MKRQWWIVLVILLMAFALRVYRVAELPMTNDESLTAMRAYGLLHEINGWEPPYLMRHIPHAVMLAPWYEVTGPGIGSRWPSVMGGVLAVAIIYRLGVLISGKTAGVIAALLLTFNPIALHYAQHTKQHGGVIMLALLTLWLALEVDLNDRRWAKWLYPPVVSVLTILHVVSAAFIGLQSGYLLVRGIQQRRGWRYWALWSGTQAAILGITALIFFNEEPGLARVFDEPKPIGLLIFLDRAGGGRGVFGPVPNMPVPNEAIYVLIAGLTALLLGRALLKRDRPWLALTLVGSVTVPVLVLYAFSHLVDPLWSDRYMIASITTMPLLLGVAISQRRSKWLQMGVAGLLLVNVLHAAALHYFIKGQNRYTDWRSPLFYVAERIEPGDAVVTRKRPVTYLYLSDYQDVITIDKQALKQWLDEDDPTALIEITQVHDRMWLVWSDDYGPMPLTDAASLQQEGHADFGSLDVYLFTAEE